MARAISQFTPPQSAWQLTECRISRRTPWLFGTLVAIALTAPMAWADSFNITNCSDSTMLMCVYAKGDTALVVPGTAKWVDAGDTVRMSCGFAAKECSIYFALESNKISQFIDQALPAASAAVMSYLAGVTKPAVDAMKAEVEPGVGELESEFGWYSSSTKDFDAAYDEMLLDELAENNAGEGPSDDVWQRIYEDGLQPGSAADEVVSQAIDDSMADLEFDAVEDVDGFEGNTAVMGVTAGIAAVIVAVEAGNAIAKEILCNTTAWTARKNGVPRANMPYDDAQVIWSPDTYHTNVGFFLTKENSCATPPEPVAGNFASRDNDMFCLSAVVSNNLQVPVSANFCFQARTNWVYDASSGHISPQSDESLCLAVTHSQYSNGLPINLFRCSAVPDEVKRWKFDDGHVRINNDRVLVSDNKLVPNVEVPVDDQWCLSVRSTGDWHMGDPAQLWDCSDTSGSQNMLWRLN